jgi:hypothetical protein
VLQALGIAKSVVALRRGRIRRGRIGPWWRIGLLLVLSLVWALFVLVLCRSNRLPLDSRHWVPDLVYLLVASALVALGWAVVKAVWTPPSFSGRSFTGGGDLGHRLPKRRSAARPTPQVAIKSTASEEIRFST